MAVDLPAEPRRILIIKPSALGDIVHALPVLWLLRKRFPDAKIDWLVVPAFAPLLEHHPLLNGVIRFDRKALGSWCTTGGRPRRCWRSPAICAAGNMTS